MSNGIILNSRVGEVKISATLAINEAVKKRRQLGETIVHFGFGQSPFPVPKAITEQLIENAHQKDYLPGAGLTELREIISQYYQKTYHYTYQTDDVFIAPGSKETIFDLLYLLEGPLLLPAPSWVSYEPQSRLLGKTVHWIETSFDDRYQLNADALNKACAAFSKNKQKILILNSPSNPTGLVLSKENINDLAKVCEKNNIIVISDEIYAGVLFDEADYHGMAHAYPEKTIVTSGLSKLFSAGGYRLGFSLIPKVMDTLKNAMTVVISETYSSASSPIQYAALRAYDDSPHLKEYLQNCNRVHGLVGRYLNEALISLSIACHRPEGAFYLFPSFEPYRHKLAKIGIETDIALCHYLLEKYQIALLPGSDFGYDPNALCCRLATCDYDGEKALNAYSIDEACFNNIRLGVEKIKLFLETIN